MNKVKSIYQKAIDIWGVDSQLDMLIEEMSELTQAILKNKRRNGNSQPIMSENFHEEFVDVSIVMEQVKLLLDKHKLGYWEDIKIDRLRDRLNNEPK